MRLKETLTDGVSATKKYIFAFFIWVGLGGCMGAVGGAVGAVFSHTLSFVTGIRERFPFLLYLLPAAGVAVALVYKLLKLEGTGTNGVFETVRDEKTVPKRLAPAVFVCTAVTHLFGGSAGREGAALQMGGSIATLLGRLFAIRPKDKHILTMCGMSALFSAVFGTPVGACIFAVEVASTGRLYTAALFPCMVSSVTSFYVASMLGVTPERYDVGAVPELSPTLLLKTLLIGLAAAVVGILFCTAMYGIHRLFRTYIKNRPLRAAVGGAIIVALTLIVDTSDYNGSGSQIIEGIFEGEAIRPEAFLLKILFTAITMGSGFKGGEIVPTLFVGATMGGTVAGIIGMSVPFGAAIGMAALFGGVTNCPITAMILAFELFGSEGAVCYLAAILITYLLTGRFSLYSGQKILFSRIDDTEIAERKNL